MEQFIQAVREEEEDIDFEVPFSIQGVKGYLSVSFDPLEEVYDLMFEWHDLVEKHVCVEVSSPEEMGEMILKMKRGIFMGEEPVFYPKKMRWMKLLRQMLLEADNVEADSCYICFEDTHGYKTPCGHDICYTCFVKCIQRDEDREFVCGICRERTK